MSGVGYYLSGLADLVLPRECIVCGRRLQVRENHLCIFCSADFPYTYFWNSGHNQMSDRLNALISRNMEEEGLRCERYVRAAALFFYNSDAGYRKIPQQLKYRKRLAMGRCFAGMLADRLFSSPEFESVDTVVPVPLHWRRYLGRGYNQAGVIAGQMAVTGKKRYCPGLLVRERNTRTQTRLSVEDKKSNVRNAFRVVGKEACGISPSHILLVDDVFTTGATIHACYHALRLFYGFGIRISAATLGFVSG